MLPSHLRQKGRESTRLLLQAHTHGTTARDPTKQEEEQYIYLKEKPFFLILRNFKHRSWGSCIQEHIQQSSAYTQSHLLRSCCHHYPPKALGPGEGSPDSSKQHHFTTLPNMKRSANMKTKAIHKGKENRPQPTPCHYRQKRLGQKRLNHYPGQPVPIPEHPSSEEYFPNIQSKPPLAPLEAVSSHPVACYLGRNTDPTLLRPPFR